MPPLFCGKHFRLDTREVWYSMFKSSQIVPSASAQVCLRIASHSYAKLLLEMEKTRTSRKITCLQEYMRLNGSLALAKDETVIDWKKIDEGAHSPRGRRSTDHRSVAACTRL